MSRAALDAMAGWLLLALLLAGAGGLLAHRWHRQRLQFGPSAAALPATRHARRVRLLATLAAMALAGFGLLALVIHQGDGPAARSLIGWDAATHAFAGQIVAGALLQVLAGISWFGNPSTLWVVGLAAAAVLAWHRQWLLLGACAVGTLGNGLLVRWAKVHFGRARPEFLHDAVRIDSYSFPSGHAAGALVVYGLLAWLLTLGVVPRWHRLMLTMLGALVAAVAASRVLLQVHYATDVLGGLLLGLAWLALVIGATERAQQQPGP